MAALFMDLATVAATVVANEEKDNKCNDNYPGAVVIKKIAKAIVIHKVSPFGEIFIPLDSMI